MTDDIARRRKYPLFSQDSNGSVFTPPPLWKWWANWFAVAILRDAHPDWLRATRKIFAAELERLIPVQGITKNMDTGARWSLQPREIISSVGERAKYSVKMTGEASSRRGLVPVHRVTCGKMWLLEWGHGRHLARSLTRGQGAPLLALDVTEDGTVYLALPLPTQSWDSGYLMEIPTPHVKRALRRARTSAARASGRAQPRDPEESLPPAPSSPSAPLEP